ncbi:MAG: hypothetical protein R2741_15225 [Methanolobus sp.]
METLLVNENIAEKFSKWCKMYDEAGVEMRCDEAILRYWKKLTLKSIVRARR